MDLEHVMADTSIPEDIRRFILTSITSVPYLEAMLLVRSEPERTWDGTRLAQRLYLSDKVAEQILAELHAAGVLVPAEDAACAYRYRPAGAELRARIDRLADVYAKNLVEVTALIHSNTASIVQRFADAFKWRKDE